MPNETNTPHLNIPNSNKCSSNSIGKRIVEMSDESKKSNESDSDEEE